MILFPAIDILENRAVRLLRGQRSEVTDYGDPVDRAKMWIDRGAEWLHVVDLGGAFDGVSHISDVVYRIAKLGVPVQCGGGLRTMEDIGNRFAAGASRVVLGTVCYTNFGLFLQAVEKYGNRIVAGIDAQNGMLAVNGWTETVDMSAITFAKRAKQTGVRYAVFTDIARDGAMTGVAAEETQTLAQQPPSGLSRRILIELRRGGHIGVVSRAGHPKGLVVFRAGLHSFGLHQVNHRIFKPLARMNRNDAHDILVARLSHLVFVWGSVDRLQALHNAQQCTG